MAKKSTQPAPSKKKAAAAKPEIVATTAANLELEDADDMADAAESMGPSGPSLKEEAATSLTSKNFRNHPDMENFFRFVYENDLRIEALQIIDQLLRDKKDGTQTASVKKKTLNS